MQRDLDGSLAPQLRDPFSSITVSKRDRSERPVDRFERGVVPDGADIADELAPKPASLSDLALAALMIASSAKTSSSSPTTNSSSAGGSITRKLLE